MPNGVDLRMRLGRQLDTSINPPTCRDRNHSFDRTPTIPARRNGAIEQGTDRHAPFDKLISTGTEDAAASTDKGATDTAPTDTGRKPPETPPSARRQAQSCAREIS